MTEGTWFSKKQKRVLLLSSLGGVLEFYDFIIYIFLAPYIEKIFFADSTAYLATLKTLAIFSIGYLLRPLGGIVFSHFGDRYGRKVVFLLTVVFMAIPSFVIGLLPTTAQIGAAAPILLLICRMMQGIALGGEIPAAITFVSEHVSAKRHGFALSTLFFGINLGLLLGSFLTTVLTAVLSPEEMLAYGWRIPFILGGFFGVISIYLRRYLRETAAFAALRQQDLQQIPLLTVFRESSRNMVRGILLVALGSISVFFYLYLPQYLSQYFNYNFAVLMQINTAGTLILNFTILLGGLLVDHYGSRKVYLTSAILLVILTYPLYTLFSLNNMYCVIASFAVFSIIFGLIPSSYSAMLCRLFPTPVRYTGVAMSYNFAYAIFGGLSPVICTVAINYFQTPLAPAFYFIAVAFMAACVCWRKKIVIPVQTGIQSI